MNKTIAIIPARGGSKRLPNKNLLLLNGIPLLGHSIMYALENKNSIDEIYVSTDDAKIKEIALQFGAKVIHRPAELSGDYEPTVSVLKHVLQSIDFEVENVILLQPTNPLRPLNLLVDCFEKFKSLNCDSLFTVSQNKHKLGKVKDNLFSPFNYTIGQRSQDLEPLFFENGLLYITKASEIFNDKIVTETVFPFLVNHVFATVDIDTNDDLEYAEFLLLKSLLSE